MNESTVIRNIRLLVTSGCITRERGVPDASGRRSRDKFTLNVTIVAAVATRAPSQPAKRKPARTMHEGQTRTMPPTPTGTELDKSESQTCMVHEQVLKDKEQKTATQSSARRVDELFEAMVEVCGINRTELTDAQRGSLNGALKQLRSVNADASEVRIRAQRYREQMPQARLTPPALAKHWPTLGSQPLALVVGGPRNARIFNEGTGTYVGPDGVVRQVPPSGRFRAE
jgi:hypothetical protein